MKFLSTCFTTLILLLVIMTGCQKDDNFVIKEDAFSVVTSGFNGSSSPLEITIDTMKLKYPIEAGQNFKRTDKYAFPATVNSVKLTIKEKESGKLVYEKDVSKGEYSITIQLIYVGGKLIEKPVVPVNNPEGIRLVSYLFLPSISQYTGDIDIVYFKKYEIIENGYFKIEKLEELTKVTTRAYAFSEFLQAPDFKGGRTEIDGKVYFINPFVMFFKSGTNVPYYEGTGVTVDQYASLPLPISAKPQVVGIIEFGSPATKFISSFNQIQFN